MGFSEQPQQQIAVKEKAPVVPKKQPEGLDINGLIIAVATLLTAVVTALGLYFKVKKSKKE